MNDESLLHTIVEGSTTLDVYAINTRTKGPGTKQQLPFYNPSMILNRDISLLIVQWLIDALPHNIQILDGLAASGIRGIRFLHELTGSFHVTINDWSPDAYALIKRNISKVQENKSSATNENIHTLLAKNRFDYVDIDPFGSPASFIDSAVRGCRHKGVIACTATDTATLCGVYPRVCRRRYFAQPLHGSIMHEVGLRILIGFLAREAAKHEKGITPLLCYSTDHYMRVYVQLENNISAANKSIEQVKSINVNEFLDTEYMKHEKCIGPLWTGLLHQKKIFSILRNIMELKKLDTQKKILSLFDLFEDEADASPFFYSTNEVASRLKTSSPTLQDVLKNIHSSGYQVAKTHFNPCGFKTNAPYALIKEIFS